MKRIVGEMKSFAQGFKAGKDELTASPVERGFKWTKFKQEEDIKLEKKRIEAETKANRAYNQGLIKGLGWRKLYLFPFLMRKPT